MMVPVLTTPRLTLRAFTLRDFEPFAALHASPHAALMWGFPTRDVAWGRFLELAGAWVVRAAGMWTLADRWSDAFLGHAGYMQWYDADEPNLTCALVENAQGRGLAEEGMRAARDWGHAHGLSRPITKIDARNTRAARLAERLGAVLERSAHGTLTFRHPRPLP